ncbi:transposase zinc-binding domain-containing protein [Sorangium sp. So ce542]|uniref:transposase zinc-binding domain-containing protein n=1 Tax=Sorangium sp. So ce542 TaxID=3133316 RepID=UPI003F60CB28
MASAARTTGVVYERRRPEKTTLYEIVRDNVETLYGAIDDGAIAVRIPKHAKKEIEAYLDCGLLCRGFARLRCERCEESRLVAFSCKGRGFCPSCLGRRMCSTAANLIEDILPEVAHRPWVLTFPFPWRRRLAQDGALFGVLTRLFVESVERFYEKRAARRGACGAVKSGAVTAVQRTSGDMRLNPHLHVVFLDGAYHEDGTELVWNELGHLPTRAVGQVLEHAVGRMLRTLRRHGHLDIEHDVEEDGEPEAALCASAVSGRESRHTSSPRSSAPSLTGLSRWTWIRSRSCAASRPASRRRAFTPSSTLACSPRQVAHVGAQAHRTAPCEARRANEGGRRRRFETQAWRLSGDRQTAPSSCAAHLRSTSSSAQLARGG